MVIIISEFGIKIKNISAGTLYDVNLRTRDYFSYTEAMLNNSLFSAFLIKNGLNVYKGESTRDIICLDFDFGTRSYEDEHKRIEQLYKNSDGELKERLKYTLEKVENNKDLYDEKKREQIRDKFYNEGVDVTYKTKNKDGTIKSEETIHYEMLFRTSAKAKLGQVIFINSELYEVAYEWLTIGLGKLMTDDNAKIVEMSAYAPLTTSTIVGTKYIPVEDILILRDQDSFFKTMANIVRAEDYVDSKGRICKKCVVDKKVTEVKNTLWDGMGLIEADYFKDCRNAYNPDWTVKINGMALMRHHLFKMCGFKSHIQLFFKDWCEKTGNDYETYQVQDMFGHWHYLKDIKIITTDNAIKWKKFKDLMGGSLESAYEYWCNKVNEDGSVFGIVKTDHPSKLGEYQQLSYQMVNTLPCTKDDVRDIASTSIEYVELLKQDNNEFEKFLRKNANEVNHYEMMADLYDHNHEFGNSTFFRHEKSKIISAYVHKLRKGKIVVNGDNLTTCGNPYALLLYSVGEDFTKDPTLKSENSVIQCYTTRFQHDEHLCAFRNPHNSPNNICYFHNVYSNEMEKYFEFSKNIIAVNNIETDFQARSNGSDHDSDFVLATNQPTMVKCAAYCYKHYPTIVNDLKESGVVYKNNKSEYARMDNTFSKSRIGIGYSSNLAQLAMTYYWSELQSDNPDPKRLDELSDNFVILSVLAQVIIDSCKRLYEIDGVKEIDRISKLPCMSMKKEVIDKNGNVKTVKCDFPQFMQYTREIKTTKDGKELPFEDIDESRNKLKGRINNDLICPMNWLQEWLDKIQGASKTTTIPTENFFIKMDGTASSAQVTKIMKIINEYDNAIKALNSLSVERDEYVDSLAEIAKNTLDQISHMKIGNKKTINRLIEIALGIGKKYAGRDFKLKNPQKYARKILNTVYQYNHEKFLSNFVICK